MPSRPTAETSGPHSLRTKRASSLAAANQSTGRAKLKTAGASVLIGALALSAASGLTAPAAMAAGQSITSSVLGLNPANGYYTGQIMSDGSIGYCDTDPQDPIRNTGDYSTANAVSGSFTSLGGNTWSGSGLQEAAYILSKYGNTTDPTQSVAVHRAQTQLANPGSFDPGSPGGAAQALADTYIADAAANAGSVNAGYSANLLVPGGGPAGTVTVSGAAGYTGTATINGPAVWANTNSAGTQFTTGQALPQIIVTGNGKISVTGTVDGIPDTTLWVSTSPTSQDLFMAGHTHSAAFVTGDVQVSTDFQPVATTNAPAYYNTGDTFTDVIHPATSDGLPWGVDGSGNPVPATYQVDIYQATELVAGKTLPATAKPIASGTATTTGGDVTWTATSGTTTAPAAGSYYSVAKFIKANQPANLQQYFTGDFTETDLTNQVSLVKATPTLSTTAIDNHDGTIADKITMICDTSDAANTPMTVTPVLNSSASAPVNGGTATAPADNKVQATLPAVTVHCGETVTTASVKTPWDSIVNDYWNATPSVTAPTLYFTESAPTTATTNELKPVYLHQDESLPQVKPTVTTQASANGTVPVTATDKATVTGTVPAGAGVTTELSWKLFKFAQDTTNSVQAVCANPFWASTSPVSVLAAGDYNSASTTLADAGTYGYVETLTVNYPSTAGATKTAVLHEGKCGENSESVVATPAGIVVSHDKPQFSQGSANVAPLANTGDVTAHQDMNTPLLYIGIGILALLAIGSGVYVQRRKAANAATAENAEALNS